MKLTEKQLIKHLEHGEWVAMKNKTGYWKVFLFKKGEYYEGTSIEYSITDSLDEGLVGNEFSFNEIQENYTEYKVIKPPFKPLQPGDKCMIIDTPELRELARELYWSSEKIQMIGMKGLEISTLGDFYTQYGVYDKDKYDFYYFPTWAVAYDSESEEPELTTEQKAELFDKLIPTLTDEQKGMIK